MFVCRMSVPGGGLGVGLVGFRYCQVFGVGVIPFQRCPCGPWGVCLSVYCGVFGSGCCLCGGYWLVSQWSRLAAVLKIVGIWSGWWCLRACALMFMSWKYPSGAWFCAGSLGVVRLV